MVENLWNHEVAEAKEGLEQLVYRSNLLGSDRSVCNWGGGNTSMKTIEKDFKGEEIEVMYVKGSGSDLATMKAENFTGLRLADIRPLIEREEMSDEEMTAYLEQCMIQASHPKSSIETLLHAFLPFKHVDHTHPDAIISLCCAHNGQEIAREIFGNRFVWVPYIRPGFLLSKMIAEAVAGNPEAELVLMEKHGLVTWGDTAKESYDQTISIIQEVEQYLAEKIDRNKVFGGQNFPNLAAEEKKDILAEILPHVRGLVSQEERAILSFRDDEVVMEFINSKDAKDLSQVGAACPDHLVHTKRTPLYIDWDVEGKDLEDLKEKLDQGIKAYRQAYLDYFNRNKGEGDILRNASPRIILIPGLGLISTGQNKFNALQCAGLYERAIEVMKGSTAIGEFTSLNEEESYQIEYWPLELYKLTLAPKEAEFTRKVALVTGAAGGIGSAVSRRLAAEGCNLVVTDLNIEGAEKLASELNNLYGEGRAIAIKVDVTKEEEVRQAFKETVLYYGGLDILVNNAGLASSSPFHETSLEEWELNMNVLSTGYFLVAREAFRVMKNQSLGGSQVFIASKNSIYAGKNATAYSTAKAAEVHLARCIAAEGGDYGIRVNSILPDAVLQGSSIWDSNWKKERAAAYGIEPEELDEHYRKRTTLQVNIYPEDIAEAVAFFASSKSSKTTGNMLAVDGGVPAAFPR